MCIIALRFLYGQVTPGQDNEISEKEGVKKKQKFVPLYSKEGEAKSVVHLQGRHVCECQAAKHTLVNNCTRCGRVVCSQEGSGPCLFCANLVRLQEHRLRNMIAKIWRTCL